MVNESASKTEDDNTTQIILAKNINRRGGLKGLSSLSYTPIKACCTAILGCREWLRVEVEGRFGIRYCTIGWFQIVILRMVSVSVLVGCEERVSRVETVSIVGVTDVSSLVVLRARLRWFVLRVFLVVLRAVGLFHRRYKYSSWARWLFLFLIIYVGIVYRVNSLSYVSIFSSWCVVRNNSCRVSYL